MSHVHTQLVRCLWNIDKCTNYSVVLLIFQIAFSFQPYFFTHPLALGVGRCGAWFHHISWCSMTSWPVHSFPLSSTLFSTCASLPVNVLYLWCSMTSWPVHSFPLSSTLFSTRTSLPVIFMVLYDILACSLFPIVFHLVFYLCFPPCYIYGALWHLGPFTLSHCLPPCFLPVLPSLLYLWCSMTSWPVHSFPLSSTLFSTRASLPVIFMVLYDILACSLFPIVFHIVFCPYLPPCYIYGALWHLGLFTLSHCLPPCFLPVPPSLLYLWCSMTSWPVHSFPLSSTLFSTCASLPVIFMVLYDILACSLFPIVFHLVFYPCFPPCYIYGALWHLGLFTLSHCLPPCFLPVPPSPLYLWYSMTSWPVHSFPLSSTLFSARASLPVIFMVLYDILACSLFPIVFPLVFYPYLPPRYIYGTLWHLGLFTLSHCLPHCFLPVLPSLLYLWCSMTSWPVHSFPLSSPCFLPVPPSLLYLWCSMTSWPVHSFPLSSTLFSTRASLPVIFMVLYDILACSLFPIVFPLVFYPYLPPCYIYGALWHLGLFTLSHCLPPCFLPVPPSLLYLWCSMTSWPVHSFPLSSTLFSTRASLPVIFMVLYDILACSLFPIVFPLVFYPCLPPCYIYGALWHLGLFTLSHCLPHCFLPVPPSLLYLWCSMTSWPVHSFPLSSTLISTRASLPVIFMVLYDILACSLFPIVCHLVFCPCLPPCYIYGALWHLGLFTLSHCLPHCFLPVPPSLLYLCCSMTSWPVHSFPLSSTLFSTRASLPVIFMVLYDILACSLFPIVSHIVFYPCLPPCYIYGALWHLGLFTLSHCLPPCFLPVSPSLLYLWCSMTSWPVHSFPLSSTLFSARASLPVIFMVLYDILACSLFPIVFHLVFCPCLPPCYIYGALWHLGLFTLSHCLPPCFLPVSPSLLYLWCSMTSWPVHSFPLSSTLFSARASLPVIFMVLYDILACSLFPIVSHIVFYPCLPPCYIYGALWHLGLFTLSHCLPPCFLPVPPSLLYLWCSMTSWPVHSFPLSSTLFSTRASLPVIFMVLYDILACSLFPIVFHIVFCPYLPPCYIYGALWHLGLFTLSHCLPPCFLPVPPSLLYLWCSMTSWPVHSFPLSSTLFSTHTSLPVIFMVLYDILACSLFPIVFPLVFYPYLPPCYIYDALWHLGLFTLSHCLPPCFLPVPPSLLYLWCSMTSWPVHSFPLSSTLFSTRASLPVIFMVLYDILACSLFPIVFHIVFCPYLPPCYIYGALWHLGLFTLSHCLPHCFLPVPPSLLYLCCSMTSWPVHSFPLSSTLFSTRASLPVIFMVLYDILACSLFPIVSHIVFYPCLPPCYIYGALWHLGLFTLSHCLPPCFLPVSPSLLYLWCSMTSWPVHSFPLSSTLFSTRVSLPVIFMVLYDILACSLFPIVFHLVFCPCLPPCYIYGALWHLGLFTLSHCLPHCFLPVPPSLLYLWCSMTSWPVHSFPLSSTLFSTRASLPVIFMVLYDILACSLFPIVFHLVFYPCLPPCYIYGALWHLGLFTLSHCLPHCFLSVPPSLLYLWCSMTSWPVHSFSLSSPLFSTRTSLPVIFMVLCDILACSLFPIVFHLVFYPYLPPCYIYGALWHLGLFTLSHCLPPCFLPVPPSLLYLWCSMTSWPVHSFPLSSTLFSTRASLPVIFMMLYDILACSLFPIVFHLVFYPCLPPCYIYGALWHLGLFTLSHCLPHCFLSVPPSLLYLWCSMTSWPVHSFPLSSPLFSTRTSLPVIFMVLYDILACSLFPIVFHLVFYPCLPPCYIYGALWHLGLFTLSHCLPPCFLPVPPSLLYLWCSMTSWPVHSFPLSSTLFSTRASLPVIFMVLYDILACSLFPIVFHLVFYPCLPPCYIYGALWHLGLLTLSHCLPPCFLPVPPSLLYLWCSMTSWPVHSFPLSSTLFSTRASLPVIFMVLYDILACSLFPIVFYLVFYPCLPPCYIYGALWHLGLFTLSHCLPLVFYPCLPPCYIYGALWHLGLFTLSHCLPPCFLPVPPSLLYLWCSMTSWPVHSFPFYFIVLYLLDVGCTFKFNWTFFHNVCTRLLITMTSSLTMIACLSSTMSVI